VSRSLVNHNKRPRSPGGKVILASNTEAITLGMGVDPFDSGKPIPYTAAVASDAVQRQGVRLTAVCRFVVSGDGNNFTPKFQSHWGGLAMTDTRDSVNWTFEKQCLRTVKALQKNGFTANYYQDPEEAARHILEEAETATTIGMGGSHSVADLNLGERFREMGKELLIPKGPGTTPEKPWKFGEDNSPAIFSCAAPMRLRFPAAWSISTIPATGSER